MHYPEVRQIDCPDLRIRARERVARRAAIANARSRWRRWALELGVAGL